MRIKAFRGAGPAVVVFAVWCAVVAAAPPAAAVNPGAAVAAGNGTISPGLDAIVGTFQSVTFSGTTVGAAVAGGSPVVVNDVCVFNGASDIAETDVQGDGNVAGSCSGSAAITANVHYQRFAAIVVLTGVAAVNGSAATLLGSCGFVPTSAQPLRSYELVCTLATI